MKLFKYLFLMSSLILSACGSDSDDLSVTFWLDNPLNTPINVTLNDETYHLEPMSGQNIELKTGTQTLTYNDQTVQFNFLAGGSNGGLINPTLSNYLVHYIRYVVDDAKISSDRPFGKDHLNDVNINGYEFEFPLLQSNSLVIENLGEIRGWVFGIDEEFDEVLVSSKSYNVEVLGKIFRQKDFIDFAITEYDLDLSVPKDGYVEVSRTLKDIKREVVPFYYPHTCQNVTEYFTNLNHQIDLLHTVNTDVDTLNEVGRDIGIMNQINFYNAQKECPSGTDFVDTRDPSIKGQLIPERQFYDRQSQLGAMHIFYITK